MPFFENFLDWFKLKPKLDNLPQRPFFKEREVWNCYFGVNIGFELDGKNDKFIRPVLVLKKLTHKKKTSLKTIEKPRLKALILEDLELHPHSSVGEIHERIGKEINIHTIRNMIKVLYENKLITKIGIKRWVKYSLYTQ